jgi:CelD/BcsL family acetyltransferase involved in cellulose biosynthesis
MPPPVAAGSLELIAARSPEVEGIWRALERRAQPAYFLTWGWIENWLACLTAADLPELAILRGPDGVQAACFLSRRRNLRRHLLPTRTVYLNETGVAHIDEVCIEHNGLLRAPDSSMSLATLLALLPDWDEVQLTALAPDAFAELGSAADHQVRIEREVASPFVDLATVRAAEGGYLSLLGSNTRAQVRRSRRRVGDLTLEVAGSLAQAFEIYDELVALHTASWRERDQPGAFADPWFDRLHRRLITQRFASGEIQLVRLRAGTATLGCGYNLISSGRVLFYQSGLAHIEDPTIKPGYLLHAATIEHDAAAGYAVYDFLAGDSAYKRALSTGSIRMTWARVQRQLARFALEAQLRRWKHELVAWHRARTADGRAKLPE